MPNAYDRQRLTITHSPVEKVDTAFGKLPDLFSPEQILEQVKEFIEQLLFPAIEELTGIDLSAFLPTIEAVFDALTTLFGDLNPLSGTFNPLDAITTFIELMVEVGANLPMALIQELTGFTGGVPILNQLIGLFTGTTGGLTGLGGLGAIFGDLTGLLGNPTALGSGTPVLGSLSSIPILGPLFGLFGGASNATQANNFFTSITSLFGNPAGLLTGSPTVPALGSIPILGPLITGLLSGGQGVNGINIFGSLFPGVVPLLGAGHVGNTQPELLANPGFDTAVSLTGSGVWTHDAATGHTANGSAKTIADGVGSKDLLSNTIPVAPNQKFNLGCWVKWSSSAGLGTPIRLGVTTYLNNTVVSAPDVANLAAAGTQATWQHLTGTYTVPAGVDAIRVRLTVLPSATAGSFWFDDISAKNAANTLSTSLIADANGNGLPDILDGLDTQLGGVLSSLANTVNLTQWTSLLTGLSGGSGSLTDIINRLEGFLTGASTLNASNIGTGAVGDTFVPGLISAFDSIVNNFLGITGTGWGRTDADHAIAANSATLLGLSKQVSQLQTVFTSGVTGGDEFERTAADLGADWDMGYGSGNGTWKTDGHNAYWSKSGTGSRKSTGRFIPVTAQTDYMFTTATLASAPEAPILPPGTAATNRVMTRMSADKQNFIYADFGGGQVKIGRCVAGVETQLASGSLPSNLGSGSQIGIFAGKPGTARYFQAKLNGGFALDVTEAGATSMVGSSYRQGGGGGTAGAWLLALSQTAPGKMNAIVVGDQ
jgi:hypothetical protein